MEINRKLYKDVYISEIGIGTWPIGGSGAYANMSEKDGISALEYYFEQGGNFIDTAQGYTESEVVISKFLANGYKNKAIVATKTAAGSNRENLCDIEPRLDNSLKRLGLDYVDLYYFHSPAEDDDVIAEALDIMDSLKKKGKIRATGASIKGPDVTDNTIELCKKYIATGKIDAIQLIYSILRQQTSEIFEKAIQNDVALIGRTSLETGFLTGKYKKGHVFNEDDHRKRWNYYYDEIVEYVEQIKEKFIGVADDNLTSLALRFAMEPKAITNTIVGVKNKQQMEEIIKFANRPALDKEAVKVLKEMFDGKTHLFNIVR